MPVEHIRLSNQAKEKLIRLKRTTGIEQWNILCRWAFCLSLSVENTPPDEDIPADSNVEMSWKVFGGRYQELYWALLKERCTRDGLGTDELTLGKQFRLRLNRGISYLFGKKDVLDISDYIVVNLTI